MMNTEFGYVTTQPVEVNTRQSIQDTLVIEETPATKKQEEVTLTEGKDLRRYCVIVGSFIYEENAIRLRKNLIAQGFWGSSIMQNSEGMFRVSAVCDDSHADAWQELCRIRSQYPKYRDAWLLEIQ